MERFDDDFKNLKTSSSVCRDITDQNALDIQELKKGIKELQTKVGGLTAAPSPSTTHDADDSK